TSDRPTHRKASSHRPTTGSSTGYMPPTASRRLRTSASMPKRSEVPTFARDYGCSGAPAFDGAVVAGDRRGVRVAQRRPFPRRGLKLDAQTLRGTGRPADGEAVVGRCRRETDHRQRREEMALRGDRHGFEATA